MEDRRCGLGKKNNVVSELELKVKARASEDLEESFSNTTNCIQKHQRTQDYKVAKDSCLCDLEQA